jgi:N-acyl-D-amino-acid deacylase
MDKNKTGPYFKYAIEEIKEGYYANLVLFDPDSNKDKATFENSTLRAEGLNFVFVSGKIVYSNQMPKKVYSVRIIKRIN